MMIFLGKESYMDTVCVMKVDPDLYLEYVWKTCVNLNH